MNSIEQETIRVMTRHHGPATLIRRYPHRDTKEMVWDVVTDVGDRFFLSQKYVAGLEVIEGAVS